MRTHLPIAAVVVRWKGGDEVERCLRSIGDSQPPPREIVLVDAGSGDGGAERLAQVFPGLDVVPLETNPGFAAAANIGVARTTAEFVFLLNPDTEVDSGAPAALHDHLVGRPDISAAVPLLRDPAGSSQYRWQLRRLPTAADLGRGRPGKPSLKDQPIRPVPVQQPAAAAWLIRRTVWDALGGLDDSFIPAWWEDVDFCARLVNHLGRRGSAEPETFEVVPAAHVLHVGGSSVSALGRPAFLAAYYGNLLRYAARHHRDEMEAIRSRLRRTLWIKALARPTQFGLYRTLLRETVGRRPGPRPGPGPGSG